MSFGYYPDMPIYPYTCCPYMMEGQYLSQPVQEEGYRHETEKDEEKKDIPYDESQYRLLPLLLVAPLIAGGFGGPPPPPPFFGPGPFFGPPFFGPPFFGPGPFFRPRPFFGPPFFRPPFFGPRPFF